MAQRTKKEKIQLTAELVDTLGGSGVLYLTDFTGLNVKEITELRRRFREAGHRFIVVKTWFGSILKRELNSKMTSWI